jgi:hypothetical protein
MEAVPVWRFCIPIPRILLLYGALIIFFVRPQKKNLAIGPRTGTKFQIESQSHYLCRERKIEKFDTKTKFKIIKLAP